ncbi:hypothetical protein, partial [Burkholderia ubonensis]
CQSGVWKAPGGSSGVSVYTIANGASLDLGWHLFCALSGMQGDPPGGTMQVWPVAGPDGAGRYDWNAQNLTTGKYWAPTIEVNCFA